MQNKEIAFDLQNQRRTRFYVLASLFAALTAAGAFVKIPFPVVPFTLQTFFVVLAGALLGPVYGSLSQLLYLIVGLIGVPVFANGGGPGYIFQPTFGYLVSYPVAAGAVGFFLSKAEKLTVLNTLLAILAGMIIIYLFGVTGLYLNLNYIVAKPTAFTTALWTGCILFIPSTIAKSVTAAYLTPKLSGYLQK
jgi:biotin transport system substrate-specific component